MATFSHSTQLQLAQRLRERFRTARGVEALKIAAWFDQNATNAQLRNFFSLTVQQATELRTRLQAATAKLAEVRAAAGE